MSIISKLIPILAVLAGCADDSSPPISLDMGGDVAFDLDVGSDLTRLDAGEG